MIKKAISICCMAVAMCYAGGAFAQVKENSYKDWDVYTTKLEGKKVCYIASFAKKKTGNYTLRDEPYILVTNVDANTVEVSVSSGYSYKDNSKIRVVVANDKTYYLSLIQGERAWAKDDATDSALVKAMRARNSVTVKGVSTKGTYSLDTYSLSGFTAAYDRMKALCK